MRLTSISFRQTSGLHASKRGHDAHARVVDQNIQAAETIQGRGHQGSALLRFRDVQASCQHLAAPGPNPGGRFRQGVPGDVGQDQPGPPACQQLSQGETDPAGGSRDQGSLAGEIVQCGQGLTRSSAAARAGAREERGRAGSPFRHAFRQRGRPKSFLGGFPFLAQPLLLLQLVPELLEFLFRGSLALSGHEPDPDLPHLFDPRQKQALIRVAVPLLGVRAGFLGAIARSLIFKSTRFASAGI